MKNRRLFLYILLFLGVSLLLAIGCIAFLQTSWAQDFLCKRLALEAKKQGVVLEIQRPELKAPFEWNIPKASIKWERNAITVQNLQLKINPLSLLKKKLFIRSLEIEELQIAYSPSFSKKQNLAKKLPLSLQIKKMDLEKIFLTNLFNQQTLAFSLSGKGKMSRNLKELQGECFLKELSHSNTLFFSFLVSSKYSHKEFSWDVDCKNPNHFRLFFGTENIPSFENRTRLFTDDGYSLFFKTDTTIYAFSEKKGITLTSPLFFKASGSFSDIISCTNCHIQSEGVDLKGSFELSRDGIPLKGDLFFSLKNSEKLVSFFPISGNLEGNVHLDEHSFWASFVSPSLTFQEKIHGSLDGNISATKKGNSWEGKALCSFENPNFPWKNAFHFLLEKEQLILYDLSLSCPETYLEGKASLLFSNLSYEGSFFLKAEDLRSLRNIIPDSELDGKLGASICIQGEKEDLSCKISCLAYNVRYKNSLVDLAHMEAELDHLLSSPSGSLFLNAKHFYLRDIYLSELSFSSMPTSKDEQTFSLEMQGDWKQPFFLQTKGLYSQKNTSWHLDVATCTGSFLAESFELKNPLTINRQNQEVSITPCLWQIGQGTLSLECLASDKEFFLKGEGASLPLNTLSIVYPRLDFQGIASFQTSIHGKDKGTEGYFLMALEQAVLSHHKKESSQAKGSLQIHFNPQGAQIYTHIYGKNHQFLEASATLPLTYAYDPFSWQIDLESPLTAELTMQGAIEDIFDFVNTSSHKSSGWITAHLFLAKTLKNPHLLGSLDCQNASYENYFTGTKLKEIQATVVASQDRFMLTSFHASDTKDGKMTATGSFTLSPERFFPFEIQSDITQMHCVKTDFIDGSFSGFLKMEGDLQKARGSGNLTVDQTTFTLSEDLLNEIPSLPVTFIHKPITFQTELLTTSSKYPLELDIYLSSEKKVFVKGRGLDSVWQGDVQLTGTVKDPTANGTLTLDKGTFVFSGKTFAIMQGEISFIDKPSPSSHIKISGELPLSGATILFQMQGPLTSPALSFQSIPSLPTSSILSLILFDKDISEISALQALSLAQTIVSLSGKGGPGVLESIRKTIGVDRLQIVGKDGTDEISLQIGWYLSHGITLSLSQSATSSDVTVEVDLKNGFIFQAETQNQEEGKFSLKWNKNY